MKKLIVLLLSVLLLILASGCLSNDSDDDDKDDGEHRSWTNFSLKVTGVKHTGIFILAPLPENSGDPNQVALDIDEENDDIAIEETSRGNAFNITPSADLAASRNYDSRIHGILSLQNESNKLTWENYDNFIWIYAGGLNGEETVTVFIHYKHGWSYKGEFPDGSEDEFKVDAAVGNGWNKVEMIFDGYAIG